MKSIIIIVLLAIVNNCIAQYSKEKFAKETKQKLTDKAIYMLCRGTSSKISLTAKEFNYSDTNITHVGIGIFENGNLIIYHVLNAATGNALQTETFQQFLQLPDIFYCSVWKCDIDFNELRKAKRALKTISLKQIKFDTSIELNNGADVLYCSEFCQLILKKINCHRFNFSPRIYSISDAFYQAIFNKDKLEYYPVDFFESNGNFKKIAENSFIPMLINPEK